MGHAKLSKNNSGPNRRLSTRCWTVIAVGDEDKEIRPGQVVAEAFAEEAAGERGPGKEQDLNVMKLGKEASKSRS